MRGSLAIAHAMAALSGGAYLRREDADKEPAQKTQEKAQSQNLELHEKPHPLNGREPVNGQERARVREWEQAKKRHALYAQHTTKQEAEE